MTRLDTTRCATTLLGLVLAMTALEPASAAAQTFRRPTACDSCIANWFYFDENAASGPDDDWGVIAEPAPPVAPDPFVDSRTDLRGLDDAPEQAGPTAPAAAPAGPVFAGLPDLDGVDRTSTGRSHLAAGPVATVHLPRRVPYGFHGTWIADAETEQTP